MSQHDLVISNADGATVRADLNSALQALGSTSKGNTRPTTVYAGQLWLDDNTPSSTTWTLYLYDGTDDIALATFDTSGNTVSISDTAVAKLATAQSFTAAQRGAITALTDGATITPDLALANNYSVTLGGNRTLANPTNITAGQAGSVFISQDGTGSRTLSWGSYWDFAGGTAPTLTTTASAVDRVDYVVRTTTSIHAVFTANYS